MRSNAVAVILGIVLPIATAALAGSGLDPIIRGIFAVPFVLISPGFALTNLLYPHGAVSTTTRIALTLGVSMVLIATAAVALTLTVGLTTVNWIIVLGTISIGATLFSLRFGRAKPPETLNVPIAPRQLMLMTLAVAIVATAFAYARHEAQVEPNPGFTQLWILPPDISDPNAFRIGARNHEGSEIDYRLTVSSADQVVHNDTFTLADGATWQLRLTPPRLGRQLVVNLYRASDPTVVYRSVTASDPT